LSAERDVLPPHALTRRAWPDLERNISVLLTARTAFCY
jgi:hypothetical protein